MLFTYNAVSLVTRRRFFPSKTIPKIRSILQVDPSCNMDLDLWDCLGRVKLVLLQNFIGLIWLF